MNINNEWVEIVVYEVTRVTATSELEGKKLYLLLEPLSKPEWIKIGLKNGLDPNNDCLCENKCVFDANESSLPLINTW